MSENAQRARRARVALDAYRAQGGMSEDDCEAIVDLIVDLLHLGGTLGTGRAGGLADLAVLHYEAELAEGAAA